MKKRSKRSRQLIALVLSAVMILSMLSFAPVNISRVSAKEKKGTETEKGSELKKFTSTEDLIADMKANPKYVKAKEKKEKERLQQQEELTPIVEEKSGYGFQLVKSEIEREIFTNRKDSTADLSKYKLNKKEMTSLIDLILKENNATTLVTVELKTDQQGIANSMKVDIDPAYALGLDELDTLDGVGEISSMTTEETKNNQQSKARSSRKSSAKAAAEPQAAEEEPTTPPETEAPTETPIETQAPTPSASSDTEIVYTYKEPVFQWTENYSGCNAYFECNEDSEKSENVSCKVESVTTEATCTKNGATVYTASCTFNGTEYKDEKTVTTPAVGHTYGDPVFKWDVKSDDDYRCTATFTCAACNEATEPIDCTVTKQTKEDDTISYIATCEFEGKKYTNEIDATTKQLYADWAALCEFYSANYEYFGVPAEFWVSKNTDTSPLGAIKVMAGYEVDSEIPAAAMDQIITLLTQAFEAYVTNYGEALLQARDKALSQLDDNMTDLQKCLVLHDYIAQHSVFDMQSLVDHQNGGQGPDPIETTPFGALLYGTVKGINGCVCLGYTAGYAYLVQNAFPEIYKGEDGKFKTYDEVADNAIVDFTMIKYDVDTEEVSVAGADSGFEGRFEQTHFFNAVQLDGQWYYVDSCYDDISCEAMSQYRVETDGNCAHLYFLYSHDTLEKWYDGYYKYIDTLHDSNSAKPCNSTQYEDAWFTNVNSLICYDDNYWYYVDTQMSYSEMSNMGQGGGSGDSGKVSTDMIEQMMKQYDTPDKADQMKARKRTESDTSEEGETILVDYGYGKVTKLGESEPVTNDILAAECNEDMEENRIYGELVHSLAVYNNIIYFNLSNKIYMYNIATAEVTQLKEYNDIYAMTDGSGFTGSSYHATTADAEDVVFHVVEHPLAALCIKDDGVMYVSIATNFSNSKESEYKVESVNFNPYYVRFKTEKSENTNDNKEFMWCANVKEKLNMSDIQNYLDGKAEMKEVTVSPWCKTQGCTEKRDTVCGCSNGLEKTNLSDPSGHHYIYNEQEGCYICSRCYAALKQEDADSKGIKTGHTYEDKAEFNWTKKEEGGYDCTATFKCNYGDDEQTVKCDVTSEVVKAATCTEAGEAKYTASCRFGDKDYTDTKNDSIPALGHDFIYKDNGDGTRTVSCSRCDYRKVEKGVPAKVQNIKVASASYNSIKITWSPAKGADSYNVYQKVSGKWQRKGTVKDGTSYTVKGVTTGINYTFTVRAFNSIGGGSYDSKGVTGKAVLSTPKLKGASAGYNSAKISWNKIAGATGYYVYRWNGKSWDKIKNIKSGKTTSYTNGKLTCGTKYKYTVVAYRKDKDNYSRSAYEKAGVTIKPIPAAPKLVSATAGKKKITIKWKKVSGASGYYVYQKEGSKLTKLKKIKNGSTTSWTNTGLKSKKKYTYVVRAYRMVKDTKVNGEYSKTSVSAKAK